ncbi:hypothetical protein GCM10010095_20300 [Streptomyces anthocyanicus]|nr:hypothetical protein GCM10010095_20300 [Streptomyces anthocyanicus]
MPNNQSPARLDQPASPSPRRLLTWVLGALMLAGLFHCPALPHDEGHGHLASLVLTGDAAPDGESSPASQSEHSHGGTSCSSLSLAPQVQGGSDAPTRTGALLTGIGVPAVAALGLFPVRRRPGRHRIATPGRSTLTIVCRWRI